MSKIWGFVKLLFPLKKSLFRVIGCLFCLLDVLGTTFSLCDVSIWFLLFVLFIWAAGDVVVIFISGCWSVINSSLHFKTIFFRDPALSDPNLLMCVTSNLANSSFQLLFRCIPCRVKNCLSRSVSTVAIWLYAFATLSINILKAPISVFISEVLSRSCLWGIFTIWC